MERGTPFTRPNPIQRDQDTSRFSSGNEALDSWLRDSALKNEGRTSRTYTVCQGRLVVGYYCLASGAVSRSNAPSPVRRNAPDPVPVMIIGRLAVDRHFQHLGIGGGMLADALRRIVQVSESVGCRSVLVHAIDQHAVNFYSRYGFLEYPGNTRTMHLPLETVIRAL